MARSWRQRCCWSITAKPLLIVSLQGVGAGGGVSHALGMPGAPPLREGAADEVTAMIVPPAVGVGHADGQHLQQRMMGWDHFVIVRLVTMSLGVGVGPSVVLRVGGCRRDRRG